ncbi:MAG: hypothetical protein HQK75_12460 [Candidatus Magnetomorum sp.]|nr:hypothetical protein [Candidatus Magnetomorum sp.]
MIAINVNPLENLKILGSIHIENPFNVAVKNSYAYVGDYNKIHIVDVSNPNDLTEENDVQTNDRPMSTSLNDQTACVALGHTGILMVDIQKPMSPKIIGQIDLPGMVMDIKINNNIAYAACNAAGLAIVSLPYEIKEKTMTDQSHLSVSSFPFPDVDGHYTLRVFNEEASFQMSGAISFINDRKKLKAIIVCAQSNDYLMPAFENTSSHAYNTLLYQGYLKENIYFLGPDPSKDIDNNCKADDINAVPTISRFLEAIDKWAIDAQELIIFMVGHGEDGAYLINTNEKLEAKVLDQHLDNLQNNTDIQSVLVIYDACYSESFAKYLKPPENKYRLIISSASGDAFFHNNGLKSFSYIFWSGIMTGGNVYNALRDTRSSEALYCSDDKTY